MQKPSGCPVQCWISRKPFRVTGSIAQKYLRIQHCFSRWSSIREPVFPGRNSHPSITHFSVQGSSGGPNGLVNIDFIRGVDIYTAGFPASRKCPERYHGINQQGRTYRSFGARITLGATDYGATIEGPMGQRSSYILSARHSFSQYLLKGIQCAGIAYLL